MPFKSFAAESILQMPRCRAAALPRIFPESVDTFPRDFLNLFLVISSTFLRDFLNFST